MPTETIFFIWVGIKLYLVFVMPKGIVFTPANANQLVKVAEDSFWVCSEVFIEAAAMHSDYKNKHGTGVRQ